MSAKRFHMCQSVRGALRNWSGKQWNDATEWITRNDGTKFNGEELEHVFQTMLDEGKEVVPFGEDCDNFDFKTGCKGHVIPEDKPTP